MKYLCSATELTYLNVRINNVLHDMCQVFGGVYGQCVWPSGLVRSLRVR